MNATYAMIEEAGFEVAGNALYNAERSASGEGDRASRAGDFRIPGGGDQLLKPEIAR